MSADAEARAAAASLADGRVTDALWRENMYAKGEREKAIAARAEQARYAGYHHTGKEE